jgi:hypothetical protein
MDEKHKDVFLLGSHPLSKAKGRQLKDLPPDQKVVNVEMYLPPGIVKKKATAINQESKIHDHIRTTIPSDKIYIR